MNNTSSFFELGKWATIGMAIMVYFSNVLIWAVFAYPRGEHDVVEVNKSGYDSCTASNNPAFNDDAAGNTSVTLATAGTHYYICTVGQHCSTGNMKVAVSVVEGATAPPPTSGSSSRGLSSASALVKAEATTVFAIGLVVVFWISVVL